MKIAIVLLAALAIVEALLIVVLVMSGVEQSRSLGAAEGNAWTWRAKCQYSHTIKEPCLWTP